MIRRFSLMLCIAAIVVSTSVAQEPAAGSSSPDRISYPHGERELAAILRDRPSMRGILPADDVVTRWVIRQLSIGANGETVSWDANEPPNAMAAHVTGRNGSSSRVMVTDSKSITGRDKWYMLVFELHNMMHPETRAQLKLAARSGAIQVNEFAIAILDHEYERIARTNRFFIRYPLPDATPQNAPFYTWYMKSKTELFDRQSRHEAITQVSSTQRGKAVIDYYENWYAVLRSQTLGKPSFKGDNVRR